MSPSAVLFRDGGYRYLPGPFQYSSGIAAAPGFAIERARFRTPPPLAEGFKAAETHLRNLGRPAAAFAGCELRSPAPFTAAAFEEFNRAYVKTLAGWGIYRDPANPVARTNVCPVRGGLGLSVLWAFSYTVPFGSSPRDFVISGAGEVRDGPGSYVERTVRYGETSGEALQEKIRCVVARMDERLRRLDLAWEDVMAAHVYTARDIGPLAGDEIFARGCDRTGFDWNFSRPPLEGLEFEMDIRAASREVLL